MRLRSSRRQPLLVMIAALTMWIAGSLGAAANHGDPLPDSPHWISQAGNGQGGSTPALSNFLMRTVLFGADSFPLQSGAPRPTFPTGTRYAAFGTVFTTSPEGNLVGQLALSKSHDGVVWQAPQKAVLRDPTGGPDVPFLLNDVEDESIPANVASYFDVVYRGKDVGTGAFVIWYRIRGGDPAKAFSSGTAPAPADSSIHTAISEDGVVWYNDVPATQHASDPMAGAAGTFKDRSFGPTDVLYNPTGSTSCHTAGTFDVWSCRYIMIYDVSPAAATTPTAIGVGGSGNGTVWRGVASPLLTPSAGQWDETMVTAAHLRKQGSGAGTAWTLHYGGADAATSCAPIACLSTGVATATGTSPTFVKSPQNPVTPASLHNTLAGATNSSLLFTQVVEDACPGNGCNGDSHARIYYTRVIGSGPAAQRGMFIAFTSPERGQAPAVRISQPTGVNGTNYRNTRATPIDVYMSDEVATIPAKLGLNLGTLEMTIDGNPVTGQTFTDTIVTASRVPALRVSVDQYLTILPEGTHTFEVSVEDHDGNETTASSTFLLDATPPVSSLTSAPGPTAVLIPGDSLGTFAGSSSEAFTGLLRMQARITNPLGAVKTYIFTPSQITPVDSKNWTWSWVAPASDPHTLLPGPYEVTIQAVDLAGNQEGRSSSNTVTILVI